MWAQVAMAGINIMAGKGKAKANQTLASAQYRLESGREENKQLVRDAQNELSVATANLSRYQQQKRNDRIGKAMEKQDEQEAFNWGKQVDGLTSARFDQRIQGASALGSLAAQAAFAGVGGASVEQVRMTEEARQARADAAVVQGLQDAKYVSALSKSAIIDNGYNQLDDSYIFADMDLTPKGLVIDTSSQHKYSLGSAVGDGMAGFSGNMDKVGVNLQAAGYKGDASLFGSGTGAKNQGLGGGFMSKFKL
ncbi:hypothetical protein ZPAH7B_orf00010 [Aeromonas phage ZPAH7B]|uniref:Internal virion protein n=2 Tax=Aerosvirus ZPAH7 TaxID=2733366 RepID=A0A3Q9GD59_9CAUD|nr:internal virion protein [Aeromonas phage ZPAH7]AZQ96391.1 hypothetical protein ZPAH7_orf00010 [Aeromonas phage ZPAH7]QAX95971.1 hypothetical protein ZPAH7B_orf00010 [Aeromonas phage ZPAH7B]